MSGHHPDEVPWRAIAGYSLAVGFRSHPLNSVRALVLKDWHVLFEAEPILVVTAEVTAAALGFMFLLVAAHTRPWLRHWGFGTIIAYFTMGVMATISGYADFADGWVKLRLLAVALPVGALSILVMRAWSRRKG